MNEGITTGELLVRHREESQGEKEGEKREKTEIGIPHITKKLGRKEKEKENENERPR